ncbi:archease [archaeon]|jgi:SHS2 domain-containing protein|nr:archease [archaeon]MBT6698028.1 archease [archaeon]
MKDRYYFIDHTADVLFRAEAGTLSGLFVQAALAVFDTQTDLELVEEKVVRTITGKNKSVEYLLFDFLDDLLLYKDSEILFFNRFEIDVHVEKNDFGVEEYVLSAKCYGEEIVEGKHELTVDVKAITLHLFDVSEKEFDNGESGWECQVLLDI